MSGMKPFNTSTKDPLSTKLRNFNASKSATRQLEVDSRRMEERLRELKMTMSQEKQERERQGSGGFWRSGKSGALTTHVPKSGSKSNRNNTEMPRPSKPKKITVLKDEPIKIPKRAPKPVVNVTARKTFQGPACGQCEDKAAALSCMECGELYCAACFAQFHMKGALKLHRSVPYQAGQELRRSINNGPISPHANMLDPNQKMERSPNNSEVVQHKSPVSMIHQQKSPVSMSLEQVVNGPSLLDGQYNEQESSASFAAALAEWRGQPQVPSKPMSSPRQTKPEVATVNEGTGTDQAPTQEIKIEFKELSMSYADKLLLKKHRRSELPPIQTPRLDIARDANSRMLDSDAGLSNELHPNTLYDFVDDDEEEEQELEEEHLRYASLFSASTCIADNDSTTSRSMVTITPLSDDVDISIVEEETSYLVQEEPDDAPVMYNAHQQQQPPQTTTGTRNNHQNAKSSKVGGVDGKGESERNVKKQQKKSISDTKQTRKKSATDKQRLLPRPPSENSREKHTENTSAKKQGKNTSEQSKDNLKGSKDKATHVSEDNKTAGGKITQNSNGQKRTSSRNRNLVSSSKVTGRNEDVALNKQLGRDEGCEERKEISKKKLIPKRPGSAQPERESSGRTSKADGRASRVKKRPVSADIGITRQPSEDLVKTSKLAWRAQHQYKHGLDEFFTAGLDGQQQQTKETTTVEHNNASSTSLPKCSFQGPGFWRPDSSLSTTATSYTAVTQFKADDNEQDSLRQNSPSILSWKLSQDLQKYAESSDSGSITPTQGMSNSRTNLERTRADGREYLPKSCIEIGGDNFSVYDEDFRKRESEVTADDEDTLEQLASELESGRNSVDDDGPLSRLSMLEDFPDGEYISFEDQLGIQQDDGLGSGLSTPCDELNIEQEMDEESMQGDFEEEERIASVMEVKALE